MARGVAVKFSGKRMQKMREEADGGRGMSRAQLAQKISVTERLILAYETTDRRPDPQRIKELADALGVAPLAFTVDAKETWTLAELRSASGWRAADLSQKLGVSLRSYRRVEAEGLVHPKQYGLLAELAACLEVDLQDLDTYLGNIPEVQHRLSAAAEHLEALLTRYIRPGLLTTPTAEEPEAIALAALYARPALTIARIVAHEVTRIRGAMRRLINFSAAADYGASAAEQAGARKAVQDQKRRIKGVRRSLPARMDSFFRCQLPAEAWRALAVLQTMRNLGPWLSPEQVSIEPAVMACLPPNLCSMRAVGSREYFQVSPQGASYVARFRSWYDALYPSVGAALAEQESQFSGFVSSTELQGHFRAAETVLFSFDGLLCRLFATNLQTVSDQLVQAAHSMRLNVGPNTPTDPVGMLRYLVRQGTITQIRRLDHVLTTHEAEAARTAQPLPGVDHLLRILTEGQWRLAVVTDHSGAAVEAFLDNMAPMTGHERVEVFGRPADPRLMKPHPHGVALAVSALGGPKSRAVLIGESVADALAAQAAGVMFIGVAATRRKAHMLRDAGAKITVKSLREIIAVVRSLAREPTPPVMHGE
ncbi:HAD family hydrolase [Streptomyces sp. NPDC002889]|uniref:HAD family hydrolase n=1 Tax=Streptomyces sp. NPDC002889 TaxID=3364669 RepID=UPI0036B3D46C